MNEDYVLQRISNANDLVLKALAAGGDEAVVPLEQASHELNAAMFYMLKETRDNG